LYSVIFTSTAQKIDNASLLSNTMNSRASIIRRS
jgi:hypothetical protein